MKLRRLDMRNNCRKHSESQQGLLVCCVVLCGESERTVRDWEALLARLDNCSA